jgi:hypothetical protein
MATLSEATRIYQATLTACRSAVDPEDFMLEELEAAEHQMNTAWLKHTIERTST